MSARRFRRPPAAAHVLATTLRQHGQPKAAPQRGLRLSGERRYPHDASLSLYNGFPNMSQTYRLLLVDDEDVLRETLAEQLGQYAEFETVQAANAQGAIQTAKSERIDLAVMDVGLPDMDGRDAVKQMRRGGFKAPIIMLTAQGSDADTVLGLEAGANDYVVKPFRFAVLLARIRAHLRQHEASEDAVFQIGPYTFHPGSKLLVSGKGSKLKLTEKETAILRFLYRAGRKPVPRDVLLQEVWGYNATVTTHTLETHIYRLRQKIEPDVGRATILMTDPGGYRLEP
jgi:DNA-binding response OmpR family regulator